MGFPIPFRNQFKTPHPHPACEAPNGSSYFNTHLTGTAAYYPRDGARAHFLNGLWWLLGGWSEGASHPWFPDLSTNEVWSTPDGVTWTLELAHDPAPPAAGPGARWGPRHNYGSCIFGGYIWIFGSDINAPDSQVWRSNLPGAGGVWEQVAAVSPWHGRNGVIAGAHDGRMHVCGGQKSTTPFESLAGHWSTIDGVSWIQHPDMPFIRSFTDQAVSACGCLIISGGTDGMRTDPDRNAKNDTWAWKDGVWRQQSFDAPWPARLWNGLMYYDDKLWIGPGRMNNDLDSDDLWYSEDLGKTWREFPAPWPPTHAVGIQSTEAYGIFAATGFGAMAKNVYRVTRVP